MLAKSSSSQTARILHLVVCLPFIQKKIDANSKNIFEFTFRKNFFLSASDATIRIWNSETGKCLTILKGHKGGISDMNFSKDGRYIVSCADDNSIMLWDLEKV